VGSAAQQSWSDGRVATPPLGRRHRSRQQAAPPPCVRPQLRFSEDGGVEAIRHVAQHCIEQLAMHLRQARSNSIDTADSGERRSLGGVVLRRLHQKCRRPGVQRPQGDMERTAHHSLGAVEQRPHQPRVTGAVDNVPRASTLRFVGEMDGVVDLGHTVAVDRDNHDSGSSTISKVVDRSGNGLKISGEAVAGFSEVEDHGRGSGEVPGPLRRGECGRRERWHGQRVVGNELDVWQITEQFGAVRIATAEGLAAATGRRRVRCPGRSM
jgi:hypothetical protein